MDIFIGIGGQTVDSGKRLEGGEKGSAAGAGQTVGHAAKTGDGFPAARAAAGMMCGGAAAAWLLNRKRRNIC